MRVSDQFLRYRREVEAPRGPIVCTWMRRVRGRLPKLTEVVLSPEAAAHFRIDAPCLLDKAKALRVIEWLKQRGASP
jgi:hypothetical protein